MLSCSSLSDRLSSDTVLARVGKQSLHISEIKSLFAEGLSPEDSAKLLNSYVDMWIKKQLKIDEAQKILKSNEEVDIERMVEDYRTSLLSYKLEQYFVDTRMDTTVTGEQMREYYNSHRNDFLLDRNLVRGVAVKINDRFRQKRDMKELMSSPSAERQADFKDMATKNNFELWDYPSWVEAAELFSHLPAEKVRDYDKLLDDKGVVEVTSGSDIYLIYLRDVLRPGDFAPAETKSVSDMIRKVIINTRRGDIIRSCEDSLYNNALKEGIITITK